MKLCLFARRLVPRRKPELHVASANIKQRLLRLHCLGFHGRHRCLHRAVGGHEDDRKVLIVTPDLGQQRQPVHLRHLEVGDQRVESALGELCDRRLGSGRNGDDVSLAGDRFLIDEIGGGAEPFLNVVVNWEGLLGGIR